MPKYNLVMAVYKMSIFTIFGAIFLEIIGQKRNVERPEVRQRNVENFFDIRPLTLALQLI